jgi:general secretion pathway protein I
MRSPQRGFTLIEILIALAVIAIALAAASRAASLAIDSAIDGRERVLAGLVLDNHATDVRLSSGARGTGVVRLEAAQAGERFVLTQTTKDTPNALVKQIDITVAHARAPDRALGQVSLYLATEGVVRGQ